MTTRVRPVEREAARPLRVSVPPADVGRLGRAAAWISAVCCLPYLVLKVAWTFDVPLGIRDLSVLDSGGWVAANAAMALVELTGLVLVLALTRPRAWRVPTWALLFPVWVGTGLLFEIVVGAVLVSLFSGATGSTDGTDPGGFEAWVFVLVYSSFAGQGVALAIAFACHVSARWGALLRTSTTWALAPLRATHLRTWPQAHLTGLALGVAGLLVPVAAIEAYWAAGGGVGLSDAEPRPAWGFQASGVAAAVTAGLGLLCLVGRWSAHAPFWLPVSLVWIGSGAVCGFDGLNLALGGLLRAFGTDVPETGWSLTDTSAAIKVAIGALAAAVGVVALSAAGSASRDGPVRPRRGC